MDQTKKKKKGRIITLILVLALLAAGIGSYLYISDCYSASAEAFALLESEQQTVQVSQVENRIVFQPEAPQAGLIFYPGGKVEAEAYAPLLEACAERGILCVLLRMPGNLAVLDRNAADGVAADYPEVTDWYIGGHSLGGAMAAGYAAKHTEALAGLVLLGAYSTADLTDSGLRVLSIYGSEDGVLNREKYDSNHANLPADAAELVIQGGCHAGFGSYGPQDGDGTPTISGEEQIARTADAIAAMLLPAQEIAA